MTRMKMFVGGASDINIATKEWIEENEKDGLHIVEIKGPNQASDTSVYYSLFIRMDDVHGS